MENQHLQWKITGKFPILNGKSLKITGRSTCLMENHLKTTILNGESLENSPSLMENVMGESTIAILW